MTEIESPLLAPKGFNTNSVQCLPLYNVIISKVHVYSFTCTISHVHRRAPKMVLQARNLVYKKSCYFALVLRGINRNVCYISS